MEWRVVFRTGVGVPATGEKTRSPVVVGGHPLVQIVPHWPTWIRNRQEKKKENRNGQLSYYAQALDRVTSKECLRVDFWLDSIATVDGGWRRISRAGLSWMDLESMIRIDST